MKHRNKSPRCLNHESWIVHENLESIILVTTLQED